MWVGARPEARGLVPPSRADVSVGSRGPESTLSRLKVRWESSLVDLPPCPGLQWTGPGPPAVGGSCSVFRAARPSPTPSSDRMPRRPVAQSGGHTDRRSHHRHSPNDRSPLSSILRDPVSKHGRTLDASSGGTTHPTGLSCGSRRQGRAGSWASGCCLSQLPPPRPRSRLRVNGYPRTSGRGSPAPSLAAVQATAVHSAALQSHPELVPTPGGDGRGLGEGQLQVRALGRARVRKTQARMQPRPRRDVRVRSGVATRELGLQRQRPSRGSPTAGGPKRGGNGPFLCRAAV